MTVNLNSKEQLAKLLATENLDIVFDPKAKTAYMAPEQRCIYLPILNDAYKQDYIYDSFISHEVGHALFTPSNLQDYTEGFDIPFPVINVIEDIRIERLIKERYPGTKKMFTKFGQFLFNNNFFEIENKDLKDDLSFLDRLNIFSKVGAFSGIELNEREKHVYDEAMACETFEQVIALCLKILDEVEEEQVEENLSSSSNTDEEGEEQDPESGSGSVSNSSNLPEESEKSEESNDDEQEETEQNEEESEDDESEEEDDSTSYGGLSGGKDVSDVLSAETLENMENNIQNELIEANRNASRASTYNIGEAVERGNNGFYVPWQNALQVNQKIVSRDEEEPQKIIENKYKDFLDENKFLVNSMVREFTSRKAADEHKRTKEGDSGVLDPRKLKDHKITEDIFMKNQVTSEGKSHGIVMFIDFSASMGSRLHMTMKQVLIMVMFARKVGIPFEVYAFTYFGREYANDGTGIFSVENTTTKEEMSSGKFSEEECPILLQLFTSEMGKKNIDSQLYHCFYRSYVTSRPMRASFGPGIYSQFRLGGTPLDMTILAAEKILLDFKARNNIQILTTMFLSDGISHTLLDNRSLFNNHNVFFDKKTKKRYSGKDIMLEESFSFNRFETTPILLNCLQDRVETNVLFYFVAEKPQKFGAEVPNNENKKDIKQLSREIKKDGLSVTSMTGRDQMMLMEDSKLQSSENNDLDEQYSDEKKLMADFRAKNKNKRHSKVFARKLLDVIA